MTAPAFPSLIHQLPSSLSMIEISVMQRRRGQASGAEPPLLFLPSAHLN